MPSNRKLSAEMIDKLADAVGRGLADKHAAALHDISPSTLKVWRSKAKSAPPQSLLARLDRRLARADAEFILVHTERMQSARNSKDSPVWTVSAWLLERKFQDDYALIQRTEIGQPGDFAKLSKAEVQARILQLVGKPPKTGTVKAGV